MYNSYIHTGTYKLTKPKLVTRVTIPICHNCAIKRLISIKILAYNKINYKIIVINDVPFPVGDDLTITLLDQAARTLRKTKGVMFSESSGLDDFKLTRRSVELLSGMENSRVDRGHHFYILQQKSEDRRERIPRGFPNYQADSWVW